MLLEDRAPARRALMDEAAEAASTLALDRGPPPPRADAVFLSRPSNRQRVGESWYDRQFDPIADILEEDGRSGLLLEHRAPGTPSRRPRHRRALAIDPSVLVRLPIAAMRAARDPPPQLDRYDDLLSHLRRHHPRIRPPSRAWLAFRTHAIASIARYFDHLLAVVQPKVALMSCYSSLVAMALSLAAARRGIPSVDVQHGVTVRNPAYEGWSRFPDRGYELLPRVFWCWSDADGRPVAAWPDAARPFHRSITGGHPWIARSEAHASSEGAVELRGRSLNILVTLTCSSGFSGELRALVLGAPREWRWWIRLHPSMDRERGAVSSWCAANAPGRAVAEAPTDLPLPALLRAADVHLTHNSSVVEEAAALGLPSVVIDPAALDVYTDELSSGWARYASGVASIVDALEDRARARRSLPVHRTYPSWQHVRGVVRALIEAS